MRKIYMSLFMLGVFAFPGKTQEVVAPAGDHFEGSAISVSWTLGELAVATLTTNNFILTQGMQQPSMLVVSVDDLMDDNLEMVVYPNPTKDMLTISLLGVMPHELSYALYDMSGTRLYQAKMDMPLVTLNMSLYAPGNYFLRVYNGNSVAKIFSVVKQ